MGRVEAEQAYGAFKSYLEERGIRNVQYDDQQLLIKFQVRGNDLPQPTIIRVIDDRDVVQILSPIPYNVPEDKRVDAACAAAIANYGLINGSFDFDMNDGEVRYRLAHSFKDSEISRGQVEYLLNCIWFTTDRYNDSFFALGMGMMTLQQFIEKESNR